MKFRFSILLSRVLPVAIAAAGIWLWVELRPVLHPPGILVTHAPVTLPAPAIPLPPRDGAAEIALQRVAQVHAQGRVLAVQRYRDEMAALAPIDIVIGWGDMSNSQIIDGLTVKQKGRKYELAWDGPAPLSPEAAARQSVNLHLIPGSPEAALWISSLKTGMLVDLRGALAAAQGHAGAATWRTSLDPAEPTIDPQSEASEDAPTLKGSRLVFVSSGHDFEGRSQQDLRARALRDYDAQETADLKAWFSSLEERRKTLDLEDAIAVREFNREATRYMHLAHPDRRRSAAAPASLKP